MKKLCIAICLVMTLLISGCNERIDIDLNEYRPLEDYVFQQHDFLMRKALRLKRVLSLNSWSTPEEKMVFQQAPIPMCMQTEESIWVFFLMFRLLWNGNAI